MRKKKMRKRRRLFLIVVGCLALALDRLEGKSTEPPPIKRGRIKIVN
jgi:hypothetical protein